MAVYSLREVLYTERGVRISEVVMRAVYPSIILSLTCLMMITVNVNTWAYIWLCFMCVG